MRDYLDELGREYAAGYLDAARQQRLDEIWLDEKMKAANEGIGAPKLPWRLAQPTTAWLMLTDTSKFPRLGALLDDEAFPIDTFRTNYKLAKECLEMNAGFGNPSTESRKYRARKLARRARNFASRHAGLLGELSERVENSACRLERANDAGDQAAIQQATLDMGELTAEAVSRVYREPKADSATTDSSPAATPDIEAHQDRPPVSARPVGSDV